MKDFNTANGMSTEEQAIKQVIDNFEEAWNKHDAKAYSLVFAEDADFTNVFGQKAHGRAAIEQFHAPIFQTIFKASRFASDKISVRFINENIAAVDVTWEMSGAMDFEGNPWADRKGLINLVMKKEDGVWLILIMHNMDLPVTATH